MSILKQSLTVLMLLGLTQAFITSTGKQQSIKKNRFGAMEVVNDLEEGLEKVVLWPLKTFSEDYV
jgi:hypothetical protein